MKLEITLSLLTFCVTVAAFGQKSQILTGEKEHAQIKQHLAEINLKRGDSTNIYSITPDKPIEIQERNTAPQHFPYPIIFIHGLDGSADSWLDFYN